MVSTMVSTRGVKFKFSEGERVLCFEPDPTKAKVLYESKVLDLVVSHDSRGRKAPEYLIHFFGWNSSWDRCVNEEFILPYTEENRDLQTKLAKDAAVTLKGKRKSKLPPLIKETLSKKPCTEDIDEVFKQPENPLDSFSSDSETSEEEMEREVTINIPEELKLVLEDDWRNVTQKDKFVKLPCEVNVITILENFVKHRASKLLCAAPPKNGNNGKQLMPEDVGNKLNLCKEAVDGLRIYFDFTLPHLLLYRQEKKQYYTVGTTCLPFGTIVCEPLKEEVNSKIKKEVESISSLSVETQIKKELPSPKLEPEIAAPPKRGRPPLRSKLIQQSPPVPEASVNGFSPSKLRIRPPPLPPPPPPPLLLPPPPPPPPPPSKSVSHKSKKDRRPKAASTRILRSRSSDKPKNTDTTSLEVPPTTTSPTQEAENMTPPSPESLPSQSSPPRHTRKSVLNSSPPIISQSHTTRSSPNEKVLSNCSSSSQPPPSLSLASNCVSSSASSTHSSLCSPTLNEQYMLKNSGLLQDVLQWRMVPLSLYEQVPAAPSLVYGSQHLLRLFVKLPDLISKMNMSQKKLDALSNILEIFLQYLIEKKDEFFQSSAYVDSGDVSLDSNVIINK